MHQRIRFGNMCVIAYVGNEILRKKVDLQNETIAFVCFVVNLFQLISLDPNVVAFSFTKVKKYHAERITLPQSQI